MHPAIHREIAQARVADLYQKAEHDRLVKAALHVRHGIPGRDKRWAPARQCTTAMRDLLALLGALGKRSHSPHASDATP
jgi:hypothetical protein